MQKTKTHLLIISLCALAVLAACETVPAPISSPQDGQPVNQSQPAENMKKLDAGEESNGQTLPIGEEMPLVSAADQAAYGGALQLMDVSFCEKISDQSFKTQCRTDIANKTIEDKALESLDQSVCDEISNQDVRQACRIAVEVEKQSAEQENERLQVTAEMESRMKTALDNDDLSACASLENQNARIDCELNVLVNSARSADDTAACSRASSEEIKQACEQEVRQIGAAD